MTCAQRAHSVEIGKFLSQNNFVKIVKKNRENNVLHKLYSKMVLEWALLSDFGANYRKFELFGLLEEGFN